MKSWGEGGADRLSALIILGFGLAYGYAGKFIQVGFYNGDIGPHHWIYMVASDADRKAIEDSIWSHGAFTYCLIKALNGAADGYQSAGPKDGIVTMGELRAFLNSAMPDETQKVLGVAKRPMITTSTGDPDIWNLSLTGK